MATAAVAVVVVTGCTPLGPAADDTAPAPVEVVRVIDGDSLEVTAAGQDLELRLLDYNAPESFLLDGRRNCNGDASTRALEAALAGAAVAIDGDETDRFGRRLVDLLVDGNPIAPQLVADGHGLALTAGDRDAMLAAAEAGRGLWGERCGEPAVGELRIGDTQADPPGPDGDRLDEEWVEIVNGSDGTVDLDGWVLRDHTTSNRFPLRGQLSPGDVLTVRTGSGPAAPGDLYLDESFPVWSNGHETVLLVDPDGVVAAWAFLDGSAG